MKKDTSIGFTTDFTRDLLTMFFMNRDSLTFLYPFIMTYRLSLA